MVNEAINKLDFSDRLKVWPVGVQSARIKGIARAGGIFQTLYIASHLVNTRKMDYIFFYFEHI